jgi:hypothetical protein
MKSKQTQIEWFLADDRYLPSYSERVNYWGHAAGDNIFVMDNHRCALYDWIQLLIVTKAHVGNFHYLHIDAHYDAANDQNNADDCAVLKDSNLSRESYLELLNPRLKKKLIRWDNYLPVFFKLFESQMESIHFFTQKIGLPPAPTQKFFEHGPWQLLDFLKNIRRSQMDDTPWLVNIDLDYFFHRSCGGLYFSQHFIDQCFEEIYELQKAKLLLSCTLITSPECCGSLELVHPLLRRALDTLGEISIYHPIHFP